MGVTNILTFNHVKKMEVVINFVINLFKTLVHKCFY